mmetsp:Transcript_12321/g.14510  ORF Transcript_12321/g.14510 Transcript_12321/m.14510 type:complete len:100 (+) Transcript_12321:796-1095(+)
MILWSLSTYFYYREKTFDCLLGEGDTYISKGCLLSFGLPLTINGGSTNCSVVVDSSRTVLTATIMNAQGVNDHQCITMIVNVGVIVLTIYAYSEIIPIV